MRNKARKARTPAERKAKQRRKQLSTYAGYVTYRAAEAQRQAERRQKEREEGKPSAPSGITLVSTDSPSGATGIRQIIEDAWASARGLGTVNAKRQHRAQYLGRPGIQEQRGTLGIPGTPRIEPVPPEPVVELSDDDEADGDALDTQVQEVLARIEKLRSLDTRPTKDLLTDVFCWLLDRNRLVVIATAQLITEWQIRFPEIHADVLDIRARWQAADLILRALKT